MAQQQLFADEYKVNLDVFEGPLDLLLYLIRREELDIYDIPIEHVTSEYMKFINEAREMNLDIAGEFIVMAATLMVIKSRMLLPVDRRTVNEDGNEEWVDPRLDLVRQLIEYKKFKDAAIRPTASTMAAAAPSSRRQPPTRAARLRTSTSTTSSPRSRKCLRGRTRFRTRS